MGGLFNASLSFSLEFHVLWDELKAMEAVLAWATKDLHPGDVNHDANA